MANTHVEQVRGVGEPARQYMWEILIPGSLPGGGGAGGGDNTMFTYRAMSTTVPDKVLEAYEHNFKSTKTRFAGRDASAKTFDVTFFDSTDLFIYKSLWSWSDYCVSAKKSEYQLGSMTLELQDRADAKIMTVKLIQVWPENVQPLTLDYSVNDPINVVVTLSYDDMEIS